MDTGSLRTQPRTPVCLPSPPNTIPGSLAPGLCPPQSWKLLVEVLLSNLPKGTFGQIREKHLHQEFPALWGAQPGS